MHTCVCTCMYHLFRDYFIPVLAEVILYVHSPLASNSTIVSRNKCPFSYVSYVLMERTVNKERQQLIVLKKAMLWVSFQSSLLTHMKIPVNSRGNRRCWHVEERPSQFLDLWPDLIQVQVSGERHRRV